MVVTILGIAGILVPQKKIPPTLKTLLSALKGRWIRDRCLQKGKKDAYTRTQTYALCIYMYENNLKEGMTVI